MFGRYAILVGLGLINTATAQFTPALLQNDSYWDDGKAEFDLYDAQIVRDGQPRPCEALHIFIRDTLDAKQSPKPTPASPAAPVPVIKMNQILNVPIGVGTQQHSLCLYWNRDGHMAQFSFASADITGNTFMTCAAVEEANSFSCESKTHRGETTKQDLVRPAGESVFYDELPLRVRTINFSKPTGEFEIQLAPTVFTSKSDTGAFKPAKVSYKTSERAINVDVKHDAGTDHFVLDRDFPFLLREWQMADGSRLKMKNSLKIDYWNYNKNGDRERALKNPMLRHPD